MKAPSEADRPASSITSVMPTTVSSALAVIASFASGNYREAGMVAFFMLLGVLMLLRRRRAVAAVAIVSTAVVASAQGRVQSFEVEQLELNPAARGGLVVGGADLLQQHDLLFGLLDGLLGGRHGLVGRDSDRFLRDDELA